MWAGCAACFSTHHQGPSASSALKFDWFIHSFKKQKTKKHPCSLCVSLLRKEADSYLDACRKMCLFLCLKGCRSLMRSSYFISKDKVMQSLKNRNPSHSCLWSFQSQPFEFGGKMPTGNISPLHRLFISFMNLKWLSHVSIYIIELRHFSKLFWLCTFPSIYVETAYNLQLSILSKMSTTN